MILTKRLAFPSDVSGSMLPSLRLLAGLCEGRPGPGATGAWAPRGGPSRPSWLPGPGALYTGHTSSGSGISRQNLDAPDPTRSSVAKPVPGDV